MALTTEASKTEVAVILRLAGEVDGETAPELDRICEQWISPANRNMILDFSRVVYISSAGLGSVLGAGKKIDRQGGRLLICGLAGHVKKIFVMSGIDSLFPLFHTSDEALADCQTRAQH